MLSKKSLVLCMCALFALTAPAMAAPSKILRVGMGDPIDSEMGAIAKRFKTIVEQRTDGDIEVQIFPSGQLGGETEMIQNVRSGSLDVAVVGIANTVPFVKKLGILTLPYLFENIYEVVRGTTGEGFEILNKYAMEEGGFQVLGYTYTDYRWLSNDIRPIKNINDVKGLKFRVPQSAVLLETYKSWGANPVPISWPETFTALQQGVVDGQCYGYITFQAFKFNEVQKYITEVHYTYQLQPMIVSMRVMKGLTPEQRDIVTKAGKDAQEFCLAFQLTESTRVKKELIASGTQIDTLEDEAVWKKLAQEHVWPKMLEFVGGKDRVDAYLEAIGKK
ncbi:TRAP transporter substrate-binding protein [Desulfotalea psychrophila]|uniref:Probable DctP (Periplasmic C4-dicarboxylate binding protein) n=1 Tax=Desulfotalea psychrophila (strain LSv54 / DSM 12343) TaxID=177439 RepID=Q6AQP7_DESPS|nr:TRAP transporter substrate-binding protein [Desulfotalea psychrophila]CAG35326.1 probable DctP (periplasmic C4-dicarboxylate binding protein) [Desulfotalea psychrophila LSv54]